MASDRQRFFRWIIWSQHLFSSIQKVQRENRGDKGSAKSVTQETDTKCDKEEGKKKKKRSPSDFGLEDDHVNFYFGHGGKLLNNTELLFSIKMLQTIPSYMENNVKLFQNIWSS